MKSKLIIVCVVLGLVGFVYFHVRVLGGSQARQIVSGGLVRTYLVHVPKNEKGTIPKPLVVVFHGAGDTSSNIEAHTQFSDFADKDGFIVAYPESYISSWADGRGVAPEDARGVNDMQFARDVVTDIEKNYSVDTAHIYATGFSSGGMFVHKLACNASDIFTSFAAVGASFPDTLTTHCSPQIPRSMLVVLGSNDPSYLGAMTTSGVRVYSGVATLEKWSDLNECSSREPFTGSALEKARNTRCKNGTTISEIVIDGAGHSWVRNAVIDTTQTVIDFFQQKDSIK